MRRQTLSLALLAIICCGVVRPTCFHEDVAIDPAKADEGHAYLVDGAVQQVFEPLRISIEYNLGSASTTMQKYIKEQLIPAALDYFKNTLKVQPLSNLRLASNSPCGVTVPSKWVSPGVNTDLGIIVTGAAESSGFVAWARACNLDSTTNRPVFGQVNFNYNYISPSDPARYEDDLATTIHELTHVFGFSSSLYKYFVRPATVATITLNGVSQYYIDAEPLTSRVRQHFGCSTAPGALLENQGTSASAGSHFERRVFGTETMTASAVSDTRISYFTLSLLEATGWYKVNYAVADPLYWGKDQGCAFYTGTCFDKVKKSPNFEEFCSPLTQFGCTHHRRHVAYCGSTNGYGTSSALTSGWNYWGNNSVVADQFADNCPYYQEYRSIDCENPSAKSLAFIPDEHYGSTSKCFTGTIYPNNKMTNRKYSYCFKQTCVKQSNGLFNLEVTIGTTKAVCTREQQITIPGYGGSFDCPDPQEFCNTVGQDYCKKGCLGRGTCSSGKCYCYKGYEGEDCSKYNPLAPGGTPPGSSSSSQPSSSSSSSQPSSSSSSQPSSSSTSSSWSYPWPYSYSSLSAFWPTSSSSKPSTSSSSSSSQPSSSSSSSQPSSSSTSSSWSFPWPYSLSSLSAFWPTSSSSQPTSSSSTSSQPSTSSSSSQPHSSSSSSSNGGGTSSAPQMAISFIAMIFIAIFSTIMG